MATNGSTDGTHKHSGFGGRLCAEPYCDEVVKKLLADYENDKSLAFNNYTDSCPELTMKRLQTMEGVRLRYRVALWSSALADRVSCAWIRTQNKPFEWSSGHGQWRRCRYRHHRAQVIHGQ